MDACSQALKEHVEAYLADKPTQSLRSVALRAGVPYTNLWRIIQNGSSVDFGTAISVMNAVAPGTEVGRFLAEYFPDKAKVAANIYSVQQTAIAANLFREHLIDFVPNQVFSLAATRAGTTRQRIESLYGDTGREALNELIACEILQQDADGKVSLPGSNYSISNPSDFLVNFMRKIERFDKSLIGTDGALMASNTETVNEDALAKIKLVMLNAFKQVVDITTAKESEGNLPVFAGLAMTLLDKTDFAHKPKGEVK